jgi:hypothetical protein
MSGDPSTRLFRPQFVWILGKEAGLIWDCYYFQNIGNFGLGPYFSERGSASVDENVWTERLKGVRIYEAYNAGSVVPLTVVSFQVKERIDKRGTDKETAFMKVNYIRGTPFL